MKTKVIFLMLLSTGIFYACNSDNNQNNQTIAKSENALLGKWVSLDPNNKNAYFLRGLARYESGQKEQGCEDFSKAIELGFSVLRIAEQEKCIDFWDK